VEFWVGCANVACNTFSNIYCFTHFNIINKKYNIDNIIIIFIYSTTSIAKLLAYKMIILVLNIVI